MKISHKYLVILALMLLKNFQVADAQSAADRQGFNGAPKLVVGVVVDQMRADYISRFWNKFSDKGFKRLVSQGFLCENNNINYSASETGPGHAAIYTGTTPSINGIISNDWYSRNLDKMVYCVGDSTPKNLLSNTITDQLRLATNFTSKVISISLKDRAAILPGGFTSNGSYWYDAATGKFITSSYYMKEIPTWLNAFNERKLPAQYLKQTWNTSLPIEQYTESTADDTPYEEVLFEGEAQPIFPHVLANYKGKGYKVINSTPFGNTLIKELACEAIKSENLGKGKTPDFLAVSFSSTDYVGHDFGINSIELEDTYLKLDKDLGDFLDYLDATIGKENTLLFLTADHGAENNVKYNLDHNIPAGLFDAKLITDLLKTFLNAKFGVEGLLLNFSNQNVYLNLKLIEEKKLSLYDIETAVANFLLKCDGVAYTNIAFEVTVFDNNYAYQKFIKNDYNAARSGDVMFTLLPGWMEWKSTGTTHGSPYNYDTHIPLIFYGWKVKAGDYLPNVNITDIAPTIANLLNIQAPSGCLGNAIPIPLK